jgi:hypothetical protein
MKERIILQQTQEETMTDKYNYRSISLRNKTHSKLQNLSNIVVKGEKLSIPKTVEKLIDDRFSDSDSKPNGIINAKNQQEA